MNSGIDALRHIFAIAVIAQHMASASRYSMATNLELARIVDWVDGAVIGFFLVSGFLFKRQASVSNYYLKQSRRLLVPFFFFSVIYAVALAALNKGSLSDGLLKTVELVGAGMQLYYLPYLLLVTAAFATVESRLNKHRIVLLFLLTFVAFLIALLNPTQSSTGSDYRLIPYYIGSFLIGTIVAEQTKQGKGFSTTILISFAAALVGIMDHRFFDLAGVVFLLGLILLSTSRLPNIRIPGSGGTYLLHTPLLNFAISTILLKMSIGQGVNIICTIILTYMICLAFTAVVIYYFPKYRWLILE